MATNQNTIDDSIVAVTDRDPEEVYGDDVVKCDEEIEVYENGKTWDCPCGHGIGTHLTDLMVTCAVCGNVLVDMTIWAGSKGDRTEEAKEKTRQATIHEAAQDEDQASLEEFF